MKNKIKTSSRFLNLDGLRGVAILSVVGYHIFFTHAHNFSNKFNSFYNFELTSFLGYGSFGVSLFFLISGFVIYNSLEKSENFKIFFLKRYFRLIPSMIFVSIFTLLFSLIYPSEPFHNLKLVDLIPGLTFIEPRFFIQILDLNIKDIDQVFWTLYVEFKFYVIAGLSFFFFKDKKGFIIGLLYIFYLISKYLNIYYNSAFTFYLYEIGKWSGAAYFCWFATGIYLFQFLKYKKINYLLFFLSFGFISSIHQARAIDLLTFLLSSFIIITVFFTFYKNFIKQIIESKFLLFLGYISYPLYLIHQNLSYFFQKFFFLIHGFDYFIFYSLLTLIFIFIISFLIKKYFEEPFRKILLKLI
jgi:peptidoglycan/LPS O-acetylase OafA/YrhL